MTVIWPVSARRRRVLVETPSFSAACFGGIHGGSVSVTVSTLSGQPDSGQVGHAGHLVMWRLAPAAPHIPYLGSRGSTVNRRGQPVELRYRSSPTGGGSDAVQRVVRHLGVVLRGLDRRP